MKAALYEGKRKMLIEQLTLWKEKIELEKKLSGDPLFLRSLL
ncbi:MAG: hypothetical protein ACFFCE_17710 [Promethearchaeota archaeon]